MVMTSEVFENELYEKMANMLVEYLQNGWRLMNGYSDCFKVYNKAKNTTVLVSIKRKRLFPRRAIEEVCIFRRIVIVTRGDTAHCEEGEIFKFYKNSRYATDSLEELNGIKFLF